MSNSKLYDVLTGLNATDEKIYSKLSAFQKSYNESQLSGDDSSIIISNKKISVKDNGITSGKLAADLMTEITNAAALTGVVKGDHISISTSDAKATIGVVTDGKYAANDTGVVSGGLLYSTAEALDTRIDALEAIDVLTGVTTSGPLSAGTKANHTLAISIQDGTTSQKGAVQLTDTVSSDDSSKAATPKAVYSYASGAVANSHTHTNKSDLDGITTAKITSWDTAYSTVSGSTGNWHKHDNKTVLDGITSAKIASWDNGALVSGVTLSVATTTTGYAKSYQLMVNGVAVGDKIDLFKDQFLKDAKFISNASASDVSAAGDTPGFAAGEPVIKFTMELTNGTPGSTTDTDTYLYVPVKDLVDTYTGGTNIKVDNNVISISGTLDASNIPTIAKSKLSSDVTTSLGYADKFSEISGNIVTADSELTSGSILVGDGNKKAKAGYTVVTGISSSSTDTQIATAKAVFTHDAYILNGSEKSTTGVEDWYGTGDGSLASILSKINALNDAIN